jgi:hypothetical protein
VILQFGIGLMMKAMMMMGTSLVFAAMIAICGIDALLGI